MEEKLRGIYLFERFSSQEFSKLVSISKVESFNRGNVVFFEGEKSKKLHILVSGEAIVYKSDNKDAKIVLHNFKAPTIIAEVANLEQIPFPASCEASSDCEFVLIDFEKFEEIFLKDYQISKQIIKSLTKKIKHLESVIEYNVVLDATARVAKYIYENSEMFKSTKNTIIANTLNIKPETLSRILKKLRDNKIIDKENIVLDREKLYMQYN
jgi:CRP/FNR family transcriptional regulator